MAQVTNKEQSCACDFSAAYDHDHEQMAQNPHMQSSRAVLQSSDEFAVCATGFAFTYAESLEIASSETIDTNDAESTDVSNDETLLPTIGPLDWRVRAGAFQLMVGATGSGKTTLLRNVLPLIAPAGKHEGTIEIFGCSIDEIDAAHFPELVGYVAQSPENQIVCDSVWHELAFGLENLGMDQDEMRRRVAEVAHFFGIEPWFRRDVATLSGGQKQIVALASVMAARPRLLLLDEPTAQLDPVAEKNFLHALFRINRELGVTVVVATHAPESMEAYTTDAVEIVAGCTHEVDKETFAAHPLKTVRISRTESAFSNSAKNSLLAITLTDVYTRYGRKDDWVLRGCDFTVNRGYVNALVGGNGAGKTTLLRAIAGTMKIERGRVNNQLQKRQAFLPQDPKTLFVCDTVIEELHEWQRSCNYSEDAIEAMIDRFSLKGVLNRHPYDLSGGQQQMLAFAKLLLTDPDLLLLDEPTKGLDAYFQTEVARVIDELRDTGITVVMATHDLSFVALVADEISMLFDGEVACTESAKNFFLNNLFYCPVENAFARQWLEAHAQKTVLLEDEQ